MLFENSSRVVNVVPRAVARRGSHERSPVMILQHRRIEPPHAASPTDHVVTELQHPFSTIAGLAQWANGGAARPRTRIRNAVQQWRAGSRIYCNRSGAMIQL